MNDSSRIVRLEILAHGLGTDITVRHIVDSERAMAVELELYCKGTMEIAPRLVRQVPGLSARLQIVAVQGKIYSCVVIRDTVNTKMRGFPKISSLAVSIVSSSRPVLDVSSDYPKV